MSSDRWADGDAGGRSWWYCCGSGWEARWHCCFFFFFLVQRCQPLVFSFYHLLLFYSLRLCFVPLVPVSYLFLVCFTSSPLSLLCSPLFSLFFFLFFFAFVFCSFLSSVSPVSFSSIFFSFKIYSTLFCSVFSPSFLSLLCSFYFRSLFFLSSSPLSVSASVFFSFFRFPSSSLSPGIYKEEKGGERATTPIQSWYWGRGWSGGHWAVPNWPSNFNIYAIKFMIWPNQLLKIIIRPQNFNFF